MRIALSIHDYAERGWLERVVRGVYRIYVPETLLPADVDGNASHA